MPNIGPANALFQKEMNKSYLLFIALSSVILFFVYRHILECCALHDDYFFLYLAGEKNIMNDFRATGRPIYGLLVKWLFSNFYFISDLKYARIVSLIGIVLFSVLLNRAYLLAGWGKVHAGCAAIITCLMPAFGVYAAWAICFAIVYGTVVAFIAGELCLKLYDCMCLKGYRLKKSILFIGTILLIIISLMIYQPAVTAFWLFVAIALFNPRKNKENYAYKAMYCFVIFTLSVTVYFVLYKLELWPFMADYFERSGLVKNPLKKLHWFLNFPFRDALSLFSVLESKSVINTTISIGSAIIIAGLFCRSIRNKIQKWQFIFFFIALIPLTYLPNLVTSESIGSFRTQGVLGSLLIFYLLLSLKEIIKDRAINIVFPCLAILFSLMAYNNVTYGFVKPLKQELKLIRQALKEPLSRNIKKIIFIRSKMNESLTTKLQRREYGFPSTCATHVPDPLINLIAREYKEEAYVPIKVYNYKHNDKISPKEEMTILNAGEILQQYKQTMLANKFNASNNIRLLVDNTKGFGDLKSPHQLATQFTPEGMVLKAYGRDPHIGLPVFNFSPKASLMIKIAILSPDDTFLQLFYSTKAEPRYKEKQSIKKNIKKGNNVVFIQLPQKNYIGSFRFDPGRIAGEYILQSIEIRGISKD